MILRKDVFLTRYIKTRSQCRSILNNIRLLLKKSHPRSVYAKLKCKLINHYTNDIGEGINTLSILKSLHNLNKLIKQRIKKFSLEAEAFLGLSVIIIPMGIVIILGLISLTVDSIKIGFIKINLLYLSRENMKYNINSIAISPSIIVYSSDTNFYKKIPYKIYNSLTFLKELKNELGFIKLNNKSFKACDYNEIYHIKKSIPNIYIYQFRKKRQFRKNAHLFNMQNLNKNEINTILNLNLSEYQRFIISKKYHIPSAKKEEGYYEYD